MNLLNVKQEERIIWLFEDPESILWAYKKYYVFNTLINGDDSLKRVYITYFGGIRVVFTTEMKYKTEAGLKDAFMHNTKIINL